MTVRRGQKEWNRTSTQLQNIPLWFLACWVGMAGVNEDLGLGLAMSVLSKDRVCKADTEKDFCLSPLPSVWLFATKQI